MVYFIRMLNGVEIVELPFDSKGIIQKLVLKGFGLSQYQYIVNNYLLSNITKNKEFQTKFNAFYIVRRDQKWRDKYYSFFEANKRNTNLKFRDIIEYLFNETGNIEPSFSSKMLATINPNMPIWDQYVIENLGLKVEGKTKKERLENSIKTYDQIVNWYSKAIKSPLGIETIKLFDELLPDQRTISDIKKIDCFLWQNR